MLAQTSTWISPGPSGPGTNWNDSAAWDNGVVPNAANAVAVFSAYYTTPQGSLTTLPGTQTASITSSVTLGELRYLRPNPLNPNVLTLGAGIDIGAGGYLRIEGTGVSTGQLAGEININEAWTVRNGGILEFANSATIRGQTSVLGIRGGSPAAGDGPGSIVFRDQSTAGNALISIPEGNTLTFLDRSSADHALISGTGTTRFGGNSTAGSAIVASATSLIFEDHASAGTAQLRATFGSFNNGDLTAGRIIFKDQATGDRATIVFQTDVAKLDLSGLAAPFVAGQTGRALLAGPLSGPGIVPNDSSSIFFGGFERNPNAGSTVIYLGATRLVLGGSFDNILDVPVIHDVGGLYGSANGERLAGGGLTKIGVGLLQITQINDYTGQTLIQEGELRLSGRVAGTAIAFLGRLTGNGTVAGNLENNWGSILPGLPDGLLLVGGPTPVQRNPIGTLTVLGNFNQKSGPNPTANSGESRLTIQIGGPTEFDRLNIGGSATVGGVLELGLINSYVPVGTSSYAFLSAASVTGTFSSVALGSGWGYLLQPELLYGSSGVSVRIQQKALAASGVTASEQALGRHFDQTLGSSAGEYRNLVVRLNGLPNAAAVATALQALTPESYGVLPEFGFTTALAQRSTLDSHFASWREQRARAGLDLYFDASYRRSRFNAFDGAPENRFRTSGGAAGAAWQNDVWTTGAELAYETTDGTLGSIGGKADVKSVRPAVFLQYASGAFFLNASVGFSRDDYELSRRIVFTGFDQTAIASPSGRRTDFSVAAGYPLQAGGWRIVPNAGLLHSTWKMSDFSETGAAGATMAFSDWSVNSSRSRLGIEVSHQDPKKRFTPRASVLWWHEFTEDRSFGARFAGATTSYVAPGREAEKNLVQGKLSLDAAVGANGVLSMGVEGLWGAHFSTAPNFSVGFRWGF